jgi:hypothetical protein
MIPVMDPAVPSSHFRLIMMRLILIVSFATFFSEGVSQTQTFVDKNNLKRIVTVLASDTLEGRGTGQPGQKKAATFIAQEFARIGLKPLPEDSGYFEKFLLRRTRMQEVYLRNDHTVVHNLEGCLYFGRDPIPEEVNKDVVFGGFGTEQELAGLDVRDKMVLVLTKNLRSYSDIGLRLRNKNCFGLIVINPWDANQFASIKRNFEDHIRQTRLSLPDASRSRSILALDTLSITNTFIVSNHGTKALFGFSAKELLRFVQQGKLDLFAGKTVQVRVKKEDVLIKTENVYGRIDGATDSVIVVTAHYDHLGASGGKVHHGADDNGSGVAGLIALAGKMARENKPHYTMVFLATTGEEAGLLGSEWHVNGKYFDVKKTLVNLNLDMIGRVDEAHTGNRRYLYCLGSRPGTVVHEKLLEVDRAFKECMFDFSLNDPADPFGFFARSDQYSFHKKGVMSLQFFSGLHSDYHLPTDTPEKINFGLLDVRVRMISDVIDALQGSRGSWYNR